MTRQKDTDSSVVTILSCPNLFETICWRQISQEHVPTRNIRVPTTQPWRNDPYLLAVVVKHKSWEGDGCNQSATLERSSSHSFRSKKDLPTDINMRAVFAFDQLFTALPRSNTKSSTAAEALIMGKELDQQTQVSHSSKGKGTAASSSKVDDTVHMSRKVRTSGTQKTQKLSIPSRQNDCSVKKTTALAQMYDKSTWDMYDLIRSSRRRKWWNELHQLPSSKVSSPVTEPKQQQKLVEEISGASGTFHGGVIRVESDVSDTDSEENLIIQL